VYSAGQTVPSTAQFRAEGNNTKCVGKKRFNGSVTHGLQKEHVLRSPFTNHFSIHSKPPQKVVLHSITA
jgi:hypothetical protein